MRTYILWLWLCLAVFPACAQQAVTLKDCISYGLKSNRSMAVASNEEKIARAKGKESLSAYLPSVGLTAGLDDNILVQKSVIPAGVLGPSDLRVAFTQQYNTTGTAQLDQVIFDKALLTGLKANKFNIQQAELNYRRSEEVVIYNISTAFYQVLVYRQQLSIWKRNEERYRIQMGVSEQQVKKGVVLETDLEKITVDYNNTRSKITLAEKNLLLSENQLKYQMGFPIKDTLIITGIKQQPVGKVLQVGGYGDGFVVTALTTYRLSAVNIALLDIDQKRIRWRIRTR
jgi:outer membrane protein